MYRVKIFYNSIVPQNDAMMGLKVISDKHKFHYEEFLSKKIHLIQKEASWPMPF